MKNIWDQLKRTKLSTATESTYRTPVNPDSLDLADAAAPLMTRPIQPELTLFANPIDVPGEKIVRKQRFDRVIVTSQFLLAGNQLVDGVVTISTK
jgi:hypothetical protein